jgi:hypothetical protein
VVALDADGRPSFNALQNGSAGSVIVYYVFDVLVTVELVTSTQRRVSLKKLMEWMSHAGGVSPKEAAMKARVREGAR